MDTVLEKFIIWVSKAPKPEDDWTKWAFDLADYASDLKIENEWLREELRLVQGGHIEALEEWGKALGGE